MKNVKELGQGMLSLAIFGALVFFMFIGVPVAMSMGVTSGLFFVWLDGFHNLTMVAQRMYSATTGFTLLAIPFFIMAGNLMNMGGVTTRIFRFASALVGISGAVSARWSSSPPSSCPACAVRRSPRRPASACWL